MNSSSNKKFKKQKQQKQQSIRVLVKCSWSGARLLPSAAPPATGINKSATIEQIISYISHQLPPIITKELSSWDDPQPSIVYMRTNVLKRDWMVTTIGDLFGSNDGDSIMLTLNLPKEVNSGADNSAGADGDAVMTPSVSQEGVNTNTNATTIATNTNEGINNDNDGGTGTEEVEPMDIDVDQVTTSTHDSVTKSMTTATSTSKIPSLTSKRAIQNILQSNFDSSSIEYFKTILKILDNIISTPMPTTMSSSPSQPQSKSAKVRTLRLSNATVQKKIVDKKHGLELLLHVIGFSYPVSSSHISTGFDFDNSNNINNSTANFNTNADVNSDVNKDTIVLLPKDEDMSKIQSVRNDIIQTLVQQLNIPMNEIPKVVVATNAKASKASKASSSFDPYKSHSFNTQSAAKGAPHPNSIIPDGSIGKSTTERQLDILQEKQKKLEQSMHSKLIERNLIAMLPGDSSSSIVTLSTGETSSAGDSNMSTKGDSSLIAMQMKKREEERRKREEGGFTTKAMRDLERMKQKKVYSHVQLRIYFPDGCRIEGKFLPNEKVNAVKKVVKSTLLSEVQKLGVESDFNLYISPPRRILNDSKSLSDEGLVPAAKIHVSWKGGKSPSVSTSTFGTAKPGYYIQPHLFKSTISNPFQSSLNGINMNNNNESSFPQSKPLAENESDKKKKSSSGSVSTDINKNAEEEMMKRMMGKKKGGLLGKARSLGRGGKSNSDNTNSGGGKGGGKPKWFKG